MNEQLADVPTQIEIEAALDPNQLSQGQIKILKMIDEKNVDVDDFADMLKAALTAYISKRDAD